MRIKFFIHVIILLTILLSSCDNTKKVSELRDKNKSEVAEVEAEKTKLQSNVDSLNKEITKLNEKKMSLGNEKKIAQAQLYNIGKQSFLDHIVIGTNNLEETKTIFANLGFSIKEERKHKNGISNFFVEFSDNSELEFISVENAGDKTSEEYKRLINQNIYGLQFALRLNKIDDLKTASKKLGLHFTNLESNDVYSTLSSSNINRELPIFFIKYSQENINSIVEHKNKTKAIVSVWLSTKNIKESARQLVELGFSPKGEYELPKFDKKIIKFENNNFEVILIEDDKSEVSGVTIKVLDNNGLEKILTKKFGKDLLKFKGKIYLTPKQTNSIWIEFVVK